MIHREGIKIVGLIFLFLIIINGLVFVLSGTTPASGVILLASVVLLIFIMRFFRIPGRKAVFSPGVVYAPADGKIVEVKQTVEEEYLKDRRIQVSIFMSVWNVHINWFPLAGRVSYYQYHPGRYLVARHPKSSLLNERNTVGIQTENSGEIVVRQIAGIVARRIVSYAEPPRKISAGDELGFIRFGSRVDLFLPADSRILVSPGQKVRGLLTPVAELP
jgi:phosphatidylserine decarboxylase